MRHHLDAHGVSGLKISRLDSAGFNLVANSLEHVAHSQDAGDAVAIFDDQRLMTPHDQQVNGLIQRIRLLRYIPRPWVCS